LHNDGSIDLHDDLSKFDTNGYGFIRDFTFALALGTDATTGANKTNSLIATRNGKIIKAFATAKTAPVGSSLIFDVNLNGSTIWSTQANRLTIADGATSANQSTFNTTSLTEGDLLTIDIDQIGSGTAGKDITIVVHCHMRNQ